MCLVFHKFVSVLISRMGMQKQVSLAEKRDEGLSISMVSSYSLGVGLDLSLLSRRDFPLVLGL